MVHNRPQTISEATLESEQFLALHIGDSESSKTVSNDTIRTKDSEIWFFQVADVAELSETPIRLFDETGSSRGPINPDSGIGYNQLYDSNGDDTLRNDDDDFTVYHYSIGVKQDDLRIYPRIPENQNGGGFTYLTGSEPDPFDGDRFGYIPGDETDFVNPSTKLESLAWRNGDLSVHQYGFYNDAEVRIDPLISVVGAAYQLRPVYDRDAMLNLLADMGKPMGDQDNKIHTVDFSRSALRTFSYTVPEEWKDAQNTLTVERANLPEDIEKAIESTDNASDSVQGGGR